MAGSVQATSILCGLLSLGQWVHQGCELEGFSLQGRITPGKGHLYSPLHPSKDLRQLI